MKNYNVIFNDEIINKQYKKINLKLKNYVKNYIINEYKKNDEGHNFNHIKYVLKRGLELSNNYNINLDILYISIIFHDIGCHINREKHEIISSKILKNDKFINNFFNKDIIKTICYAIEDHRASNGNIPRNIYGKILSSADRKVDVYEYIKSSIGFYKNSGYNKNDCINKSYEYAKKKFGHNGYGVNKCYIDDEKYRNYLNNINYLIKHKNLYNDIAINIFNKTYFN